MNNSKLLSRITIVFGATLAVALTAMPAWGQYEPNSTNTGDPTWIAASWDNPFGMPSANIPGSGNAASGGLASDDVTLSHHETAAGTQLYQVTTAVGDINNLLINGGANSTGNGGAGDHVQLRMRDGGQLTVNGTTTFGGDEQGSILFNQNTAGTTASLSLLGDVEVLGTLDNHFIQLEARGDTLEIAGDIANNPLAPALNNGAGTAAAWSESVDLVFNRHDGNLLISGTNQIWNLDELRVGNVGNNNGAANPIDYTFDNNVTINADDIFVGRNTDQSNNNEAIVAIATFDSATVVTDDDIIVGGFTSNNGTGNTTGEGTVNFGDATNPGNGSTVFVGDDLLVGQGTGTPTNLNDTATGTVNINDGYVVTVNDETVVGGTPTGTGTINVNDGVLNATDQVYLGGNSTTGVDDGATGTLNIGPAGVVNAGLNGTANRNVEVGRDGDGFLNIDGGTLDIATGNLVLGQNNSAGVDADNARGTVDLINGATLIVGSGAVNDLNFNQSGGDFSQDNSFVTVSQDLNMSNAGTDTPATNVDSSYTISGTSTLDVARNFNSRNNTVGTNTFTIIDDDTDVNVGGSFVGNQSSFVMEFDFDNTMDSIYDFNLDVAGNTQVGNATIDFLNAGDLSTFTGDILLFDTPNDTNTSQFANAAQGTVFGDYMIVYDYSSSTGGMDLGDIGGGTNIALVRVAVPEPGTLAFFGICALGLASRRRRS